MHLDGGSGDEGQGHTSGCLEASPQPFLRRCRRCSEQREDDARKAVRPPPGVTPRRRGASSWPRGSASWRGAPGFRWQVWGKQGECSSPNVAGEASGAQPSRARAGRQLADGRPRRSPTPRPADGLSAPSRESSGRGVPVNTPRNATCSSASRSKRREAAKTAGSRH